MEEITIPLEEYNKLIKTEQKYDQLKQYIIKEVNNNQLSKILEAIESKSLYELITETYKEDKK